MDRRDALKLSLLAGAGLVAGGAQAQQACATDGTPAQFTPKKPADATPLEREFEKYPKCPYCGMDRTRASSRPHAGAIQRRPGRRRLLHPLPRPEPGREHRPRAEDDLGPGLRQHRRAAPAGAGGKLTYLIGADLKHAMTKRSKHSFASADDAEGVPGQARRHGRRFQRGAEAVLPRHGSRRGDDPQESRGAAQEGDEEQKHG
jgi:copper chaperone NosL